MHVLIVEDEAPAAQRLAQLIKQYDQGYDIIDSLESVKQAVNWFQSNDEPDLMFFDIQLADGLSFEIFEHIDVKAPVIFTTAYDEYALRAFKVNSIDYLLKPIDLDDLKNAFTKLKELKRPEYRYEQLERAIKMINPGYKNRFLVKTGEHIKAVNVDDILYFYSKEKATFCTTRGGRNYLLDQPLMKIVKLVNPNRFFQISRQFIIAADAIEDMVSYSSSRLKIQLPFSDNKDDAIVSRDKVAEFKQWLDR